MRPLMIWREAPKHDSPKDFASQPQSQAEARGARSGSQHTNYRYSSLAIGNDLKAFTLFLFGVLTTGQSQQSSCLFSHLMEPASSFFLPLPCTRPQDDVVDRSFGFRTRSPRRRNGRRSHTRSSPVDRQPFPRRKTSCCRPQWPTSNSHAEPRSSVSLPAHCIRAQTIVSGTKE
jgi:hypothetical protein